MKRGGGVSERVNRGGEGREWVKRGGVLASG